MIIKGDNLKIDCLAFADDLAIIAESIEDAAKQINILQETATKAGLHISFEKTEYMTDWKETPKYMETKFGRIKKATKFKYLGEIVQPNALDKEANLARARKMEAAFQLTKNLYNKKSLSINAKLQHYNTVIKPECLYASECLSMNTAKQLGEIEKKERKIVRKILGPKYENGKWKLRSNKEIYERIERILDTMRKRRVAFYGYLRGLEEKRLTKRIFNFFDKNPKTSMTWIKEVKADVREMEITEEERVKGEKFRAKVKHFKGFQEKIKKKTGVVWTDERREQQSERMKSYWKERKEKRKKK